MDTQPVRPEVISKVTKRIIPFAFICYVVAYIDRVNIGFAARELQRDLGLSATNTASAPASSSSATASSKIPSNLVLERVGARLLDRADHDRLGPRLDGDDVHHGRRSFYFARVVLGIAEAGFFPGMVLYLTYWIPRPSARAPTPSS